VQMSHCVRVPAELPVPAASTAADDTLEEGIK